MPGTSHPPSIRTEACVLGEKRAVAEYVECGAALTDREVAVLERPVTEVAPLKVVTHKERCDYETIGYGPKTRAEAVTDLKSRTLVCTKAGFDTRGFIQGTARDGNVCFGFGGGPLVAPGETEISGILSWGEAWCSETSQRANYFAPLAHPENAPFVDEALAAAR